MTHLLVMKTVQLHDFKNKTNRSIPHGHALDTVSGYTLYAKISWC